jgi:CheY-like chemotaxis protein
MTITSGSGVTPKPFLLIVEDSDEDFEVLQRFIVRSPREIPTHRCVSGDKALAFLYRTDIPSNQENSALPGLIILDLNLPGTDGRDVLRRIKGDNNLKAIPVVVLTTSNNPKDIKDCYLFGVNSYIIKPINFSQLKRDIQTLLDYWLEVTTLPNYQEI